MENKNLPMPSKEAAERMEYIVSRLDGVKNDNFTDEHDALYEEQCMLWDKFDFEDRKFEENGLTGVKNYKGEVRVPARYSDVLICYLYGTVEYTSLVPVVDCNGKIGFVDVSGKEVCKCKYDGAEFFDFKKFKVELNGMVGLVNEKGTEVVPCEYDEIYEPFGKVNILEKDEGLYGLYYSRDNVMVPCIFGAVEEMNGYVYVSATGEWGYVDVKGNFIPESDKEKLKGKCLMRLETDEELMP